LAIKVNTHLIAVIPSGPKFDAAKRFEDFIKIVTPAWVRACHKQRQRLPERDFALLRNNINEHVEGGGGHNSSSQRPPSPNRPPNHPTSTLRAPPPPQDDLALPTSTPPEAAPACPVLTLAEITRRGTELLRDATNVSFLFLECVFFVLDLTSTQEQQRSHSSSKGGGSSMMIIDKIGQMIRHGLGTIMYRMDLEVTHILVLTEDNTPVERDIE
jgi:hypothetical protein